MQNINSEKERKKETRKEGITWIYREYKCKARKK